MSIRKELAELKERLREELDAKKEDKRYIQILFMSFVKYKTLCLLFRDKGLASDYAKYVLRYFKDFKVDTKNTKQYEETINFLNEAANQSIELCDELFV